MIDDDEMSEWEERAHTDGRYAIAVAILRLTQVAEHLGKKLERLTTSVVSISETLEIKD